MSSDKFCLKWNDFQENIVSSYQDLRSEFNFSDVTLVCEEDHQIEAHKIILSACSPFFSSVLKRNKHPHPLFYMRGIKAKDMVAVVDFIYTGEANIYQDDLDGFLALAEELQLKGLAGSQTEATRNLDEPTWEPPKPKQKKILKQEREGNVPDAIYKYSEYSIEDNSTSNAILPVDFGKVLVDSNMEDLMTKIDSLAEKVDDGDFRWKCKVCGKLVKVKRDMGRHIETHLEGVSHTCNQCGKVSRSSNALVMHISTYHRK